MAIKRIERDELDFVVPHQGVRALSSIVEREWYADDAENIIGLVAQDRPDSAAQGKAGDRWLYIIFEIDEQRQLSIVSNASGFASLQQTRKQLLKWMEEAEKSGGDLPLLEVPTEREVAPEVMEKLRVLIDPGTAPEEEIAEVLARISILYRKVGGSGINFSVQGVRLLNGGEGLR